MLGCFRCTGLGAGRRTRYRSDKKDRVVLYVPGPANLTRITDITDNSGPSARVILRSSSESTRLCM